MKTLINTFLALGLMGFASSAQAQTAEWTLGYVPVKGTIYEEVALAIPDRIAAATDGQVKITLSTSLVKGNRSLEAVRDGLLQMTLPIPAYYTGSIPIFTVPYLPGLSENYDDMKALGASPYGQGVIDMYNEEYNSTQVMETAFCEQVLFSNVPITTIEEWKGRKLRVNNRGTGLFGAEVGATTVSLSVGEVMPALQRGVIEGVITDSCWAYGAGFASVISEAAGWKLGSVVPSPVLINNDALAALSEDLQVKVLAEFAAMNDEFEARWRKRAEEMPGLWEEAGVNYTQVAEEEITRAYQDQYQQPIIDAWRADMERVGMDPDATLAIARKAVGQ